MNTCEHKKFKSTVSINKSITNTIDEEKNTNTTSVRYFLKLVVSCEECGQVFEIIPPLLDKNSMEITPSLPFKI